MGPLLMFFSESRKANFTYKDGRIFSGNFVSGKVNNYNNLLRFKLILIMMFSYNCNVFLLELSRNHLGSPL